MKIRVSGASYPHHVGKHMKFADGKIVKTYVQRPPEGAVINETFDSPEEYFGWRGERGDNEILYAGTLDPSVPTGTPLKYKKDADLDDAAVAGSNEYLAFREGPTIGRIDIDRKTKDEVAALYPEIATPIDDVNQVRELILRVAPYLEGVAMRVSDSSSSMLYHKGKPVKGSSGFRVEFVIDDGRELPRVLTAMHQQCWIENLGWAFVDKAGRLQERSLVDLALARPHQPDFIKPKLGRGVTQRPRVETFGDGMLTSATVPNANESAYREALARAETSLEPHRSKQMTKAKSERVEKLVAKGKDRKKATEAVEASYNGVLHPSDQIIFEDGKTVSCLELMHDGEQYDGKRCLDPVEPDYRGGESTGAFYWHDGNPLLISYAHCRTNYRFETPAPSQDPRDYLEHPGLDIRNTEPDPPRFIIEGILPCSSTLLQAPGHEGKSVAVIFIGLCIACGIPIFGREVKQGKVLYDFGEDSTEDVRRLIHYITRRDDRFRGKEKMIDENFIMLNAGKMPGSPQLLKKTDGVWRRGEWFGKLDTILSDGGYSMVMWDTLSTLGLPETDGMNEACAQYNLHNNALAEKHGVCMMGVHHIGQAMTESRKISAHAARGATALADGARCVIQLQKHLPGDNWSLPNDDVEEKYITRLHVLKHKWSPLTEETPVYIYGDGYQCTDYPEMSKSALIEAKGKAHTTSTDSKLRDQFEKIMAAMDYLDKRADDQGVTHMTPQVIHTALPNGRKGKIMSLASAKTALALMEGEGYVTSYQVEREGRSGAKPTAYLRKQTGIQKFAADQVNREI